MIRKANLIILTILPILVLTLGIVQMRTALATTYYGACPNVIGTMNVCPSGLTPFYNSGPYPTCHSLVVHNSGGRMDLCCQYVSRDVGCGDGTGYVLTGLWYVEYYDHMDSLACDPRGDGLSGGSGLCNGGSGGGTTV